MNRSTKFWVSMVIFQIAFGFTVFALTREHYLDATGPRVAANAPRPAPMTGAGGLPQSDLARFATATALQPPTNDPVEISRRADEFFKNQQFAQAAAEYERLIALSPESVETYNNLGITLHYLGRSNEAVQRLKEGIAIDPSHQRIWLTLGFVSGQLGQTEQSRTALTRAVEMNPDNDVGQSAAKMLAGLPEG